MVEIQCSIILPLAKGNITHELSIKTQSAGNKITWDRGKISARSFLYRFTGCLDLARSEGQKQQMLLQAGNTRLDITPIFTEITLLFPQKPVKFLTDVRKQQKIQTTQQSEINSVGSQNWFLLLSEDLEREKQSNLRCSRRKWNDYSKLSQYS